MLGTDGAVKTGVPVKEMDLEIILTGGTTRIPKIQQVIENHFGKKGEVSLIYCFFYFLFSPIYSILCS
jgi:hypothetical protein